VVCCAKDGISHTQHMAAMRANFLVMIMVPIVLPYVLAMKRV
jgi:hypothetical protein